MSREQCCALDDHGKRCRKRDTVRVQYHGDPETHSYFDPPPKEPSWVTVSLCSQHRSAEPVKEK